MKFRSKERSYGITFEAVQYTGKNAKEVCALTGLESEVNSNGLIIDRADGVKVARIGDWVTAEYPGEGIAWSDENFKRFFEEVK